MVHDEVSKPEQSLLHLNVPCEKPLLVHVAPANSVPSQASPDSKILFPQIESVHASPMQMLYCEEFAVPAMISIAGDAVNKLLLMLVADGEIIGDEEY